MAYARTADASREFVADAPRLKTGRGLFRRLFDALVQSRQRAAEREIEVFLRGRGDRLTDDLERDIDRILFSSSRF